VLWGWCCGAGAVGLVLWGCSRAAVLDDASG